MRSSIVARSCSVVAVGHCGCIIVPLECRDKPRSAVKRGAECHEALTEKAETSQAHRQALNPIAWAGSRKWIVKDGGRKGGGGGEGRKKKVVFFPSSSSFFFPSSVQQSAKTVSPNAAAVA